MQTGLNLGLDWQSALGFICKIIFVFFTAGVQALVGTPFGPTRPQTNHSGPVPITSWATLRATSDSISEAP